MKKFLKFLGKLLLVTSIIGAIVFFGGKKIIEKLIK